MEIAFVLSLLFTSIGIIHGAPQVRPADCDKKLIEMDGNVNKMLVFNDPAVTQFTSKQDLNDKYCKPFKSWIKQAAEYKPCLKNFPATLFGMVLTNIRQTWKLYCSDDRKMQIAYHHLSCMTSETKPALGSVYHKVTTLFESLMKVQEMSDFLPGVCCGVRHMITTSRKDLARICSSRTGPESADYFVNLVYTPMSDAVDLICSSFREVADCETRAPRVNAMIRKTLNEVKTYNHTAIIPMVSLLTRLDRELSAD